MPSRRSKPNPSVSAVVLAAGESKRFKASKLLERIPGGTIIEHTLSGLASGSLDQIVVVASSDVAGFLSDACLESVAVVTNESPAKGISLSIRLGLNALRPVDGVLMVLADMPFVDQKVITRIVDEFDGQCIVVPVHDSRRGNPVLFPWSLTPELLSLEGDKGGKSVIERHQDMVRFAEAGSDSVLIDIDTRDDLAAAEHRLKAAQ